jgi:NAD(P)-dependent dehydrogenase (short-subunit alcohol dehydrogenase family)
MRYIGGAVGFGFGAMWMTVGIGAAIACLLLAALGYGVVLVAERAQSNAANASHRAEDTYYYADADLPLTADEIELERARITPDGTSDDEPAVVEEPAVVDEPAVAEKRIPEKRIPVAAKADYGWPVG